MFFESSTEGALDRDIVLGLLAIEHGSLEREIQKLLLTRGCDLTGVDLENFERMVEQGLREVKQADIKLKHEDPTFIEQVKAKVGVGNE